ncbi:hypothetical protein F4821DRAFT_238533 [Hypoxylon rubiginosum]|uniref:Uncharacterized protein n=1 Tax=Hypoxylon rubiginosum TaxID=110542 RepID=A0ACC0D0R9_9PEZI|nr:hypothetical protein F4821DRAFT_238533 [Hypoxylon rubiginosum]
MSAETTTPVHDFVTIPTFKALLWLGIGLMTVAFITRAYIRLVSFRRLFSEDWLMLLSLCMFLTNAVLATIYMQPLVDLVHLADGTFRPGPTFKGDTKVALEAFAATAVLANLGTWLVKLNFLLFFYRFGHQLLKFRVSWWFVSIFVVASGITQIGLIQFDCMINDVDTILATCSSASSLQRTHRLFIISVVLDILTDFLIICFPISILWSSRITLRQKLVLSAIFSLVGFTITVTILRGSTSISTSDLSGAAGVNIAFTFWFNLEYTVAFLIACIVSFRSLFVQRRNRANLQARRQVPASTGHRGGIGGLRRRMRELHDTLLDTCRELEGCDAEGEVYGLPMPASGLMTVDFSRGETASDWTAAGYDSAEKTPRISTQASCDGSVDQSIQ